MECNGIMKKYIRVSKNESEKSVESDGRKDYKGKCSQWANDMGRMSNRLKRKDKSEKRKE